MLQHRLGPTQGLVRALGGNEERCSQSAPYHCRQYDRERLFDTTRQTKWWIATFLVHLTRCSSMLLGVTQADGFDNAGYASYSMVCEYRDRRDKKWHSVWWWLTCGEHCVTPGSRKVENFDMISNWNSKRYLRQCSYSLVS